MLQPKAKVMEISPYVDRRVDQSSAARIFKLFSNESPFPPSLRVQDAFRAICSNISLYPDGGSRNLREALAAFHGIEPERIVCGNGSDELLVLLANTYVTGGDEVIMSSHAFFSYKMATLANDGTPVEVPSSGSLVDSFLAAVTSRTRLIYVANPNNPTGTYLSDAEVRRLHLGIPEDVLLVIDAAYAEYVTCPDYHSGIELVRSASNVVMTRTFSKAYSLAGLRVGWAYCPAPVAQTLNRVRGTFNINSAAQIAAVAALDDQEYLSTTVKHNTLWRTWLTERLNALGLDVTESSANFLLIGFGAEAARGAFTANNFLTNKGLILRDLQSCGLINCLRLTVGSEEANLAVADALCEFQQIP